MKTLLWFRQNSKWIREQNATIQKLSLVSKDTREVQKKKSHFFSDSLQGATTDTLGTGIELSSYQ